MTRRRNGKATIEDTRQMLAAANAQLTDLRRRRTDELQGAADEATLDNLDAEIRKVELTVSRHAERIGLLEASEREAEDARRVKEKESLILRLEKKIGEERCEAASEIVEGIAKADAGLRRLIDIARDVQSAWPWRGHELIPCLLAPSAILSAIEHEIYRQGARPVLGGGMDKFGAGIHFPGGKPTRIEVAGMPKTIRPLVDVMQEASDLASAIMRGKTSNASVSPVAMVAESDRQRTPAQAELEQLLRRQSELALDVSPSGEAAYQTCIAEIARVSALVDAEKQTETHNG